MATLSCRLIDRSRHLVDFSYSPVWPWIDHRRNHASASLVCCLHMEIHSFLASFSRPFCKSDCIFCLMAALIMGTDWLLGITRASEFFVRQLVCRCDACYPTLTVCRRHLWRKAMPLYHLWHSVYYCAGLRPNRA